MDLPLRMVLVWALCTLEGILLLWRYDYWLGVPLFTYILAYASYRGAVTAASGYGTALQVVMALGRRNLYESLSMEFPPNLESERRQNEDLGRLLAGEEEPELDFTASTSFKKLLHSSPRGEAARPRTYEPLAKGFGRGQGLVPRIVGMTQTGLQFLLW